jgi:hypothetical protein
MFPREVGLKSGKLVKAKGVAEAQLVTVTPLQEPSGVLMNPALQTEQVKFPWESVKPAKQLALVVG